MPKDVISKYYEIAEFFDDDIDSIAIAIRAVGATNKPTWIYRDLTELWIKKYEEQIDFLYELITNEDAIHILKAYIRDIMLLGDKYSFKPSHFIKKGAANKDIKFEKIEKCKKDKKYDNQMCFNFEWE